ncbi:MAG: hypothetical protein R3B72_00865 [Polyangiaceae bacterium]
MSHRMTILLSAALAAGSLAACVQGSTSSDENVGTTEDAFCGPGKGKVNYGPGYNLHLEDTIRFTPLQPGADAEAGRQRFGVSADLLSEDSAGALFEGFSAAAGRVITGNGRSCFTCHRGLDTSFGMPKPPVTASVPLTDPMFTGINADAQGDPRAMALIDNHALFKYRPNRFNLSRPDTDPYRQVFFWRKSQPLMNLAFTHGFLNDGRGRAMFETDRGAVFSHTQETDDRFDDLFPVSDGNNMEAFQRTLITDPVLEALLDPNDPMHDTLVNDPFYTVNVQTASEHRGQKVFEKYCFNCHSMPNVFGNRDNVTPLGHDDIDPDFPTHGPGTLRTFNIGISEANFLNLEFTRYVGPGQYEDIVLPLINEDGSTLNVTVDMDLGLAATTGRVADIGRFKVPQLRNVKNLGPYMHDNSLETLADVVEYFDSPAYNQSEDGKRFPIHLNHKQKQDLLAFLELL